MMHRAILKAMVAAWPFLVPPASPPETVDRHVSSLAALGGKYGCSTGFESYTLTIRAKGRFTLEYRNCTGGFSIRGGATFVDGHLLLRTGLVFRFLGKAPTDLIPICWGDRLYLVPKDAGENFCDHVNLDGSPGYPLNTFYLREGDDKKPVEGLPTVPAEWKSMLLPKPVNGEIVEIINTRRARVNFGRESGVWKGMELWTACKGWAWVTVVEVQTTSCVIKSNGPDTVFKLGDKVSSRATMPRRDDRPLEETDRARSGRATGSDRVSALLSTAGIPAVPRRGVKLSVR
jgi:hypothetical protein